MDPDDGGGIADKAGRQSGGHYQRGGGLDRAYALHLAQLGADVVVNDIDMQAAKQYGKELTATPTDLAVITRPALIVHSDRDPFFPVNIPVDMYRAIPNAELCILPGTGHAPPREQPGLFVQIVTRFLDRHRDD